MILPALTMDYILDLSPKPLVQHPSGLRACTFTNYSRAKINAALIFDAGRCAASRRGARGKGKPIKSFPTRKLLVLDF